MNIDIVFIRHCIDISFYFLNQKIVLLDSFLLIEAFKIGCMPYGVSVSGSIIDIIPR